MRYMGVVGEVRVRELSACSISAMAGKKPTRGITSFFPVLGRKRPYSDPDKPEDASAEEGIQASSSASARKDPAPPVPSKHKQGHYDTEWEKEFSWVYPSGDGKGIYCRLCKHFNERNSAAVFNITPCISLRKDVLARHADSRMHKSALWQEHERLASEQGGGIVQAFSEAASVERKAALGAMKCLYWLAKNEIAHTTKYVPLLELARSLGCTYFDNLHVGGNATYTSERIIHEFIIHMSNQIEKDLLQQLVNSPCVSLMCDETTDISVLKQMVIYGKYLTDSGDTHTVFLRITDLFDGKAETIETALLQFCDASGISMQKVMGFGSDGAAVMIGRRSGVSTRLRAHNPFMINIHCVAHRLALAAAQSSESIPYLKKFKNTIHSLYLFYHRSSVRMTGLHALQDVLGDPEINLKEAKDVRWLSHNNAVQSLRRTLSSVVASLEREAAERGEPMAIGLVKMIKTYLFVASLYLFCDVLPHVCRLSLVFQQQEVDLSLIRSQVSATLALLSAYEDNPTPSLSTLEADLSGSLQVLAITVTPLQKTQFASSVQKKYIKALKEHLDNRLPSTDLLDAFCIFDPAQRNEDSISRLQVLIEQYCPSDPPFIAEDELKSEWELFRVLLSTTYSSWSHYQVMKLVAGNRTLRTLYPNLCKLVQICLILPLSTADCERAFSTMKRVKTPLRNRLNTKTLDSLMRIRVEGPDLSSFDFELALNNWAKLRNRRIKV